MVASSHSIPRYAMLSIAIRGDLQRPLREFSKLDVINFYRTASRDMTDADLRGTVAYSTPVDLYRKLVSLRPNMIQGVEPFAFLPMPYLAVISRYVKRYNCPLVVISCENRPLAARYGRIVASVQKIFLERYLKQASLIIYLNEGTRRNLEDCSVSSDRMTRLMYGTWGVDLDEFTPNGSPHIEDDGTRYVLYVGRIIRAKGVFDLADAFKEVVEQVCDVKLVFVGMGADRERLQRYLERLGILSKVRFAGPVLNEEIAPYFTGASVLASPSVTTRMWEEQIGMTNIQAMACGTPIVSTMSGAIPEYVPDGVAGLLVPEQDSRSLAQGLVKILTDTEYAAEMGANGRLYAEQHYNARANIQKVEDVLLRLL